MEDQRATEAEPGSTADLQVLVQWKPCERETQGKNRSHDFMSGHSDLLMTEDVTRTLLAQECSRDLITPKIVLLQEQGQRGLSGKRRDVREL